MSFTTRMPPGARAFGLALAVALAVLASVVPASAQTDRASIDRARSHMERAQELYLARSFEEAAAEFERAFEAEPFSAFLYNAGVALEHAGKPGRAADMFARYLERDPRAPDAPNVRERISRLRTDQANLDAQASGGVSVTTTTTTTRVEVPAGTGETTGTQAGTQGGSEQPGTGAGTGAGTESGTGTDAEQMPQEMKSLLAVRTNPAGATVTLRQGTAMVGTGPAPFTHTLDEGEYRLIIQHPDYRTVQEVVHVRRGKVYVVIVEMSQGQFLGYLRVVSNPPGASVFIDNRAQGAHGTTPFQNAVATGEHRIWIDKPGYGLEERRVQVGVGEDVVVNVDLARTQEGRLRIVANQRGASVYVDDRPVGTVPLEHELPPGAHVVRVEAEGMEDWQGTVYINAGQVTPVRVRLNEAPSQAGAYVTTGFAVALVAGGIVMGVLSNGVEDEILEERDAGRLSSDDPRLLEGQLLAVGADVSFGLGALLGILAVYYFASGSGEGSQATILQPRDWAVLPRVDRASAGADLRWSF